MPKNNDAAQQPAPEQPAETPKPPAEPAIAISFDRWFSTTGKPAHHKAGMQAFTKTAGRKTVAQWNAIFANY